MVAMDQQYVYYVNESTSVNSVFMKNHHSGSRLRRGIRISGKSPSQVAHELGVSNQTLNNWFTRGVPGRRILDAAKLLGLRPEWLQTGEEPSLNDDGLDQLKQMMDASPEDRETLAREERRKQPMSAPYAYRYPVISWSQTAELIDPIEIAADPKSDWYVSELRLGPHAFWIEVKGTSMLGRSRNALLDGSLVLVDPEDKPKPGNILVARLKGTDELIVRELVREAGDLYMKPLNPEFPMKLLDDNWEVVGTCWDVKIPTSMFH